MRTGDVRWMKFDGRMLGLSTFWASHWSPRVKNRTPWSGWQLGCSWWWVRAFIHSIFCCETFNVRYTITTRIQCTYTYHIASFCVIKLHHQVYPTDSMVREQLCRVSAQKQSSMTEAPENRSQCNDMEEFNLLQALFSSFVVLPAPFWFHSLNELIGRLSRLLGGNGICMEFALAGKDPMKPEILQQSLVRLYSDTYRKYDNTMTHTPSCSACWR